MALGRFGAVRRAELSAARRRNCQHVPVLDTILAIVALVLALAVPLGIERAKKPRLELTPSTWSAQGAVPFTFAVFRVQNKPISWWPANKLLSRDLAQACKVTLEYQQWATGARVATIPVLQGRWSSHTEPFRIRPADLPGSPGFSGPPASGAPSPPGQLVQWTFDPSMDTPEQDIPATTDGDEIAVAILRADGSAYVFNNDSYARPGFDGPKRQLATGDYRIVARVTGANFAECSREFKLAFEDGNFSKFRLTAV